MFNLVLCFPWKVAALGKLLYTVVPCSAFHLSPNHPTHTRGDPNARCILAVGRVWELQCYQWWIVLFLCAPPIVFHACALLPAEQWEPSGDGLTASADRKTLGSPSPSQWHTRHALYYIFMNRAQICGNNGNKVHPPVSAAWVAN